MFCYVKNWEKQQIGFHGENEPFFATDLFLYPLRFCDVLGDIETDKWQEMA